MALSWPDLGSVTAVLSPSALVRRLSGSFQGWGGKPVNTPAKRPPADDDMIFEAWATCRKDPSKRSKMPPQEWRGPDFAALDCGEDAFMVTQSVLGVADGVGSWRKMGVNPGLFSNRLLENAKMFVDELDDDNPVRLIQRAYDKLVRNKEVHAGSSTVCMASLEPATANLRVANLGDSGLMVVRGDRCHFHMEERVYGFNTPFQLAVPHSRMGAICNKPADSAYTELPLQEGDLVVMGSDGLFDNLFPEEIAAIASQANHQSAFFLTKLLRPPLSIKETTELLEKQCFAASKDRLRKTPFGEDAGRARINWMGGKPDDITVVMARVRRRKPATGTPTN
eukprot:RCo052654